MTASGNWYIELEDGSKHNIYRGDADTNPLEEVDAFDCGGSWEVDVPELTEDYPESPVDNSLVRIPKDDVVDVFFVPDDEDTTAQEPQSVGVMSGEEAIERIQDELS